MSYNFRLWIHGVIAAVIGGASNGVLLIVIAPAEFNIFDHGDARKLFGAILVSGLFFLATYLKEHPLPDPKKDNDAATAIKDKMADLKEAAL